MQTHLLDYLEATAPRLPRKTAYSDGTDSVSFAELLRAYEAYTRRVRATADELFAEYFPDLFRD